MIVPAAPDDAALNTGDGFHALLGIVDEREVVAALERSVSEGLVVAKLRRRGAGPEAAAEAYLLSEQVDCGVLILVEKNPRTGGLEAGAGWAFEREGAAARFTPERVLLDPGGHQAVVMGRAGDAYLKVFDTFCRGYSDLVPGEPVAVALNGWASRLSRARNEPVRLNLADMQPDVAATFAHGADASGMVTIHTDGMASLLSGEKTDAPFYALRGPIKAVEPARTWRGRTILRLLVTAARLKDGDLDVLVCLNAARWEGDPPRVGDDVEGQVWLHGVFGGAQP
jgi:hypothetical protein